MCSLYPDSSLDKLWDLAHHVDAKHHARLANGAQEDGGAGSPSPRWPSGSPRRRPRRTRPSSTPWLPAVVPGDPNSLEAVYQHSLAAGLPESTAPRVRRPGLQLAAQADPRAGHGRCWSRLQAGGASDLWVLDRYTGAYTGPTNPRALLAVLGRCGWAGLEGLVDPAKGALAAPLDRLLATFGAVVHDVSTFYGAAGSCDHVDPAAHNGAGTLHLAARSCGTTSARASTLRSTGGCGSSRAVTPSCTNT